MSETLLLSPRPSGHLPSGLPVTPRLPCVPGRLSTHLILQGTQQSSQGASSGLRKGTGGTVQGPGGAGLVEHPLTGWGARATTGGSVPSSYVSRVPASTGALREARAEMVQEGAGPSQAESRNLGWSGQCERPGVGGIWVASWRWQTRGLGLVRESGSGLPRPRALPPSAAPPAAPRQPCTGHICCGEPARTPPPGSVPMETGGRGSCCLWPSDWFPLEPACFPRGSPSPRQGLLPTLTSAGLSCAKRPSGPGLPVQAGIPPRGECPEPCPGLRRLLS